MNEPSLLARSVGDFLDAVGSEDEPVPAGACMAALTGAGSAALLALVCRVLLRRRHPPDVGALIDRAAALQARLEGLIDADAAAYQAFMSASKLEAGPERDAALADATRPPLDIAAACLEVVAIGKSVQSVASGSVASDPRVAVTLAQAAAAAALDTAAHNLASLDDSPQRASLNAELERLRSAR